MPKLVAGDAPVKLMVAVFEDILRPVVVVVFQGVLPPPIAILDAPRVRVRVFELVLEKAPQLHVCPLVFKVPWVTVTVPLAVKVPPKTTDPVKPVSKVRAVIDTA